MEMRVNVVSLKIPPLLAPAVERVVVLAPVPGPGENLGPLLAGEAPKWIAAITPRKSAMPDTSGRTTAAAALGALALLLAKGGHDGESRQDAEDRVRERAG